MCVRVCVCIYLNMGNNKVDVYATIYSGCVERAFRDRRHWPGMRTEYSLCCAQLAGSIRLHSRRTARCTLKLLLLQHCVYILYMFDVELLMAHVLVFVLLCWCGERLRIEPFIGLLDDFRDDGVFVG